MTHKTPDTVLLPQLSLSAGLYLIATPIGNLGDISLRALATIAGCDALYCEDTRVTRVLLSQYGLQTPLKIFHDHSGEKAVADIIQRIQEGAVIGLCSDAGMPLISDPGHDIVAACLKAGVNVTSVPGANASLMALQLSGLPSDSFTFAGFLPPKTTARKKRLEELKQIPTSLIFYETANRLEDMLADALEVLGDRDACVGRELTKRFESFYRAQLSAIAIPADELRGECVVVIAPPLAVEMNSGQIDDLLRTALKTQSVKEAAAAVATISGEKKSTLYARALELKNA